MHARAESFQEEQNRYVLTHWHKEIEILHITKGQMNCTINGKQFHIREGDVCIINQKQLHRIFCDEGKECNFQRIMVDPSMFTSNPAVYEKYIRPILSDENFSQIMLGSKVRYAAEISNLMEVIIDLEERREDGYELGVIAALHQLLQTLYSLYQWKKGRDTQRGADPDTLLQRRMVAYIYSHYEKKISLEDIARAASISKSKCNTIFKRYTGLSPIAFLNLHRLSVSTDLLRESKRSIAEISQSCGFEQQSYYNRLFLREYGVTPNAYRRQTDSV